MQLRTTLITTLIALAACVSCGTAYAIGDGPGNGGDPAQFEVYDRAQYANLMLPSMTSLSDEELTVFSEAVENLRVDMDITLPRMGEVRADPERPGMRAVFVQPEMVRDAMKSADKFDLTQWVVHEVFQTRLNESGKPWDMSEEISRKLRFNEAAFQAWRNAQSGNTGIQSAVMSSHANHRAFPASGEYLSPDAGFVWNPVQVTARPAFNEVLVSDVRRNRTWTVKDPDEYTYSDTYTFSWSGPAEVSLTRSEGDGTTVFRSDDVPMTLVVKKGGYNFFTCTFSYRVEMAYYDDEVFLKELFPSGIPAAPKSTRGAVLPCQFANAPTWKTWNSPLTPPTSVAFGLHQSYYKNEADKAGTPQARAPWDLFIGALTNNLPLMRKAIALGASPDFRSPRFGLRAIDEAALAASVEAFTMLSESTNLNIPFIGEGVPFAYPVTRAIATSARATAEQRAVMYKIVLAHTTPEQQGLYLHDGFFTQDALSKHLDQAGWALKTNSATRIAAYRAKLHPATALEMIAAGFDSNGQGWDWQSAGQGKYTSHWRILDRLAEALSVLDVSPWNADCTFLSYETNMYNDLFRAGARHDRNGPFMAQPDSLAKWRAAWAVRSCSREKRFPNEVIALGLVYNGNTSFPYEGSPVRSCLMSQIDPNTPAGKAGIKERSQVFRLDRKPTPTCEDLRAAVTAVGSREVLIEWWQPNYPNPGTLHYAKVTPITMVEWQYGYFFD